ncbi:MAG: RNA methyltransferase [Alphaproteobacteria bacterium]|nr:MAG: RNA methyltransferase [Alphaproteobacteria bacterium]
MNKFEKLQKNIDNKLLTIKYIGSRGEGVSNLTTEINYRVNNYTFFIPFTLPDEIVVVKPTLSNSEGVRADLVEIKSPSPKRIDPKCEHFFQCGGCLLQHWNLEDYISWKLEKISLPILKISPTTMMKEIKTSSIKSRRRAKFKAKKYKSNTIIGFNEYRSKFITKIEKCLIIESKLQRFIHDLEKPLHKLLGIGDEIDVHANLLDNGIDLLISGIDKIDYHKLNIFVDAISKSSVIRFHRKLKDNTNELLFTTDLSSLSNKSFSSITFPPPGGFLQATIEGENAILESVMQGLNENKKTKLICELFCGSGTITLPLLKKPYQIHAFELDKESLKSLDIAARKESFGNRVKTKVRDLKNFPLTSDELSKYDAIIVDPPRSGAKLQFLNIAKSNVSTIISISCNVNTFVRDAKILIESNYELKWVQPIDQFLFSAHVELVAIFQLK